MVAMKLLECFYLWLRGAKVKVPYICSYVMMLPLLEEFLKRLL